MKCPKCGYLGFETTDRCRNCQYDFSLAPFATDPELTLHNTRAAESSIDFELPPIQRQSDKLNAASLDLDRLFGEPEFKPGDDAAGDEFSEPMAVSDETGGDGTSEPTITLLDSGDVDLPRDFSESASMTFASGEDANTFESEPVDSDAAHESTIEPGAIHAVDEGALPFDDAPLVPPPAARPPLAVRRSTPEFPRNRPRTTRPVRPDSLNLESPSTSTTVEEATETMRSLLEAPSLGSRVFAGLIDLLLLVGIDAAILYLTLKVTGLQSTLEDLRVLPPVPFVGFLALLAFGYLGAFTVAGGQTIGKMVLSLRVIGDDGRPIDAAGGMLRALGCMLVPVTFGLSYLPVLFTSDHRAIHDRLAGTRVVQE